MSELQSLISNLISGDDELAEFAAVAIATSGKVALPALEELLVSHNPDHRWWATRVLAGFDTSEVKTLLLERLQDDDFSVRQCAALAIKSQPFDDAILVLVKNLSAEDRLLSRLSADALIAIGAAAVPTLISVLKNGAQRAQGEAARALALIGDTRAIPVMFEVWEYSSILVQYWIEEGFERMGVGMTFFDPN